MQSASPRRTGFRLPRRGVRAVVAAVLRPMFSPALPVWLQRRLIDTAGGVIATPRGTVTERCLLGGRPAERILAPGAAAASYPDARAVLYLHGGGYTLGSPRSHRGLAGHLSQSARAAVYLLDYRRAPEHPHPAALDDTAAAYEALLADGYRPEQVALAGDSAGGGLVLAATLRLRDAGRSLPAALALISPWADLTLAGESVTANAGCDALLRADWLHGAAAMYRGSHDAAAPELSPLHADLTGLPPMHVQAGGDELLVSDADRLVARARDAGVPVSYRRGDGLWHDFQLLAGWLADADDAVTELGAALRGSWGDRPPTVAIVGAGFGGVGMGIELKRAGIDSFTIFDTAPEIGGVWRDNTYPGAACDVPSHLYSFATLPGTEWSRRFSPQRDILGYLRRCATDEGIDPHLRLDTEITRADFDESSSRWRLRTATGEVVEADVLVPACGQLSRPAYPRLPGMQGFLGTAFHSARWEHSHDLTGRDVAVIGTGASAIQFVPAIAPAVRRMTLFQRSAPYVIPKPDRGYSRHHHWLFDRLPISRVSARLGFRAFFEAAALGLTRYRWLAAPLWIAYRAQLRLQVHDPAVRAKLTPDYEFGCKRVLISSDFYPALNRPGVEVVTEPIAEITPHGVRTSDGTEHPCDTIIYGTGFSTHTWLAPMQVHGLGGRELGQAWEGGARAYLGMAVSGFPNLFLLYGPNTNLGSGSIIHMLESQARYVLDAVATLARPDVRNLDVRPDVESAFDREMQGRLAHSAWAGCDSWYRTEDGRISNNWPGLMAEYTRRTRRVALTDYRVRTTDQSSRSSSSRTANGSVVAKTPATPPGS